MSITIIGVGMIGCAWTCTFVRAGRACRLYDESEGVRRQCTQRIRNILVSLEAANQLDECGGIEKAMEAISVCDSLEEALLHEDIVHVQECAYESLAVKSRLFATIDNVLSASTRDVSQISLASSSSAIPASQFTATLRLREQCLIAHPINPPFAMRLVEIVPAPYTDKSITESCTDLMRSIGQKPILLKKELKGFLQPRLQYALLGEAFRLIQSGACTAKDIDDTVKYGLAPRWLLHGAIQTCHLNAPNGFADYCERYLKSPIQEVLDEQDNSVLISDETVRSIDEEMRRLCENLDVLRVERERLLLEMSGSMK